MEKDDIIIRSAIMHILDSTVGMPVLADNVLEHGSDFLEFVFIIIITIGDFNDFSDLCALPFYYRKKWCHYDSFNSNLISKAIVNTFIYNMFSLI